MAGRKNRSYSGKGRSKKPLGGQSDQKARSAPGLNDRYSKVMVKGSKQRKKRKSLAKRKKSMKVLADSSDAEVSIGMDFGEDRNIVGEKGPTLPQKNAKQPGKATSGGKKSSFTSCYAVRHQKKKEAKSWQGEN